MTSAGTSNELDVQNGWEENTHNTNDHPRNWGKPCPVSARNWNQRLYFKVETNPSAGLNIIVDTQRRLVYWVNLRLDDNKSGNMTSYCTPGIQGPTLRGPCMAINVSVQYDGGFLPDIILLTQCYYHRGTRLNAMKRFCIFSY